MEIAALVIAIVGVGLATLSLGWQAATFFLSGPRIKVNLREGLRGPLGLMLAPASIYTAEGRAALERMGYTEQVVAVEAVNRGRLGATVNNWSVKFGNGAIYGNPSDMRNPQLPYRLEPHTSMTWCVPMDELHVLQESFADLSEESRAARGTVDLPGRDAVVSRDALLIEEGGTQTLPTRGMARRLAQRLAQSSLKRRP